MTAVIGSLAALLQDTSANPSVSDTDRELLIVFVALVAISVIAVIVTLLYWRTTGRAARARFEAEQRAGHPGLRSDHG